MPRLKHGPLTRDVETDVLIVGAGITGGMVGEALATAGLKTVIIDKRAPMKGATSASTALVQYEIDTPLIELTPQIGKKDAIRAWRRTRLAVDALSAHLREIGVDDAIRRDALYLAGNALD